MTIDNERMNSVRRTAMGFLLLMMMQGSLVADEGDYVCDGENLLQFVDGALEKAGSLVVSDTFSEQDATRWEYKKNAHNWEAGDSGLRTKAYGGALPLRHIPEGGFVLQVKVNMVEMDPDRAGGFTGVSAMGVLCTISPHRFWWQYRRPGDTRSAGQWKEDTLPLDQWRVFKIVYHPGGRFEWFVDGEKICSLMEPELKGGISLRTWRAQAAFQDFRLYKIDKKADTENQVFNVNRIQNSSFENYHDNLPPFWRPVYRDIPFTHGSMEAFLQNWSLDRDIAYHGEQSLRMKGSQVNGVRSHYCPLPQGEGVFSLYMKSDVDSMPVQVFLPHLKGLRATFDVGPDWKRYTLPFSNTNRSASRTYIYITPKTDDTLWVDAVQLEDGSQATDYQPNSLDHRTQAPITRPSVPASRIIRMEKAPEVDGKLDEAVWASAGKAPDFRIPATIPGAYDIPTQPSEAYLGHDDRTLYIGFKCMDSDIEHLAATLTHDSPAIAGEECVEVFIDTNHDRQTFYRFFVNALGAKFQSKGSDDLTWSREWRAETYRGETFWSVEIAIPLASLDLDPLVDADWRLNLCRSNLKAGEYSCTAPVLKESGMYFHDVASFSSFIWDDAGVFRPYVSQFENLKLVSRGENQLELTGDIVNHTAEDFRVIVEATVGETVFRSTAQVVKKGERKAFAIPGFSAGDQQGVLAELKLISMPGQHVVAQANRRVSRTKILDILADRSYYTTESNAVIQVSMALADDLLVDAHVVLQIRDSQDQLLYTQRVPARPFTGRLTVPIKGFPVDDYQVEVRVDDGKNHMLARATQKIQKRPPKPGAVKIDPIRRIILLDDQPFFPFAPLQIFHVPSSLPYGNYDEKIDVLVKYWADQGFSTIMAGANVDPVKGKWGKKIWDQIFTSAEKHGVKIIAFWTGPAWESFSDPAFIHGLINRWKDEPALLAWVPEDEPEIKRVKPSLIASTIKAIQKLDPYHPTYINYTQMGPQSRYAGLPGQIMSLDYYLTSAQGRTVKDTLKYVDIMQEVSAPMHVPVWNFVVGSNLDNHPREPSAGEQVAQTYGNVIGGVSGLTYFFGQVAGREHWQAFKQLNTEIEQLTPILLSGEAVPSIRSNHPDILVTGRRHAGKIYVICVNVENREQDGVVDLSTLMEVDEQAAVTVLFEDREHALSGGLLKDRFEPYQRHVYEINSSENPSHE